MRLWHETLIPNLPRRQLLGQHRECCALRGLGWGRKHATVDYVFQHPFEYLTAYHAMVMDEMERRGYRVDPLWRNPGYRGKQLGMGTGAGQPVDHGSCGASVYPEHNDAYLAECLQNLAQKGVTLDWLSKTEMGGKN